MTALTIIPLILLAMLMHWSGTVLGVLLSFILNASAIIGIWFA